MTAKKKKIAKKPKQKKKSNYSVFRKSLSQYLRDNNIRLGNRETALARYSKLSSKIWQESKGLSIKTIEEGYPIYVNDFVAGNNLPTQPTAEPTDKPRIPLSVTFPRHYYDIQWEAWRDFPKHDNLYVTSSSIMPKGVSVKLMGTQVPDADNSQIAYEIYEKAFKHWVDWCNKKQAERDSTHDSDKIIFFYAFSEDCFWNITTKRWEIEVYSCDREGNYDDFGYVPPDYTPSEVRQKVEPTPAAPTEQPTPPEAKSQKERELEKEIELTNRRIELANKIIEMKKLGISDEVIAKLLGI